MQPEADYWDVVCGQWQEAHPHRLWRAHSDAVNADLLARWLPPSPVERLLKTDLFDEAVGGGLYPLLAARSQVVVGLDISAQTALAAHARYTALPATAADVRHLPFAAGAFDIVVSNSTLDHFASLDDVALSLRELARVLRPGGELLLTLDNLANPAVALRNALPFSLLNRLGIVPYYVGASCGPRRLGGLLRAAGFDVRELGAILHCPRSLAVAVAGALEKRATPPVRARFQRLLAACERLSHLPTRFLTGHYLAARAVKR